MLCCWLQQLQEFGGPEVDKPDLLKGSIGSLKNLGLNNTATTADAAATTTTTMTTSTTAGAAGTTTESVVAAAAGNSTAKNNSGTASLAKHNAFIDRRARYNVSSSLLFILPHSLRTLRHTYSDLQKKDFLFCTHGVVCAFLTKPNAKKKYEKFLLKFR